ncbi:MAG: hypothetical protein ACKO96_21430, partial [Flammeovirgaceae bacterium]
SAINKVGYHLPYFETTDEKHLLNVKSKHVKINDLKNYTVISCGVSFKHYKMGDVEGYFFFPLKCSKVPNLNSSCTKMVKQYEGYYVNMVA